MVNLTKFACMWDGKGDEEKEVKVFHIRFSTESSDHWNTFVLAESLNDVKKGFKQG